MDDKTSIATSIQGLDLVKKKSELAFCISPAVITDESPKMFRKLSNSNQKHFMVSLLPMGTIALTPTLKSMRRTVSENKSDPT